MPWAGSVFERAIGTELAARAEPSGDDCSSCRRIAHHGTVLVTLTSPDSEYQLCRHCLGRDGEPHGLRDWTALPAIHPRSAAR